MTIFYEFEGKLYANITNTCPCSCVFCIRKNGDSVADNDSLVARARSRAMKKLSRLSTILIRRDFTSLFSAVTARPMQRAGVPLEVAKYGKADYRYEGSHQHKRTC